MYDLFNMLLDSVCQKFVKDFCIYAHQLCWPVVFLFCGIFGFGIRVMVASQNEFGTLPSSAIFWKSLCRLGVSSYLNFWWNSAVRPSGPGLLFAGRFLITVSIFMLVMGLLRFSTSPWFSFVKLYYSKNFSISSKLSILLAYSY